MNDRRTEIRDLPGVEARGHLLRLLLHPRRLRADGLVHQTFLPTQGLLYAAIRDRGQPENTAFKDVHGSGCDPLRRYGLLPVQEERTMIIIQLVLYCALFTLMVKLGVGGNALNGLFFYPRPVQEKAYSLGLTERETVSRRRKRFMIAFFTVMAIAMVLIIRVWNGIHGFGPAYLQALMFLEVMNWYDGIVIDRLWVGHSTFWIIPGTEDIPFVQTWPEVLKKRGILSLIWIAGAAVVAGLVVLIS